MNFFPNWHKQILFLIVSIFVVVAATNDVAAQTVGQATVILRTGEKVKGTVIEAIPDQYIKLRTTSGNILTVNADNIRQIRTKESVLAHRKGFSVLIGIDASYDFTSGLDYKILQPRLIIGSTNRGHSWGIGLSLLIGENDDIPEPTRTYREGLISRPQIKFLPLFFNYRKTFGIKRFRPIIDVSVGYPLNLLKEHVTDSLQFPSGIAYNYYYPANMHAGLFHTSIMPGIAVKLGKVHVAFSIKYNLLIFQERYIKYETEFNYFDTRFGKKLDTQQRTRYINSIGVGLSFIY